MDEDIESNVVNCETRVESRQQRALIRIGARYNKLGNTTIIPTTKLILILSDEYYSREFETFCFEHDECLLRFLFLRYFSTSAVGLRMTRKRY